MEIKAPIVGRFQSLDPKFGCGSWEQETIPSYRKSDIVQSTDPPHVSLIALKLPVPRSFSNILERQGKKSQINLKEVQSTKVHWCLFKNLSFLCALNKAKDQNVWTCNFTGLFLWLLKRYLTVRVSENKVLMKVVEHKTDDVIGCC
jgi:hypothetical protein